METLDGSCALPARWRGGIVALGNFDGVHLGHQAVVGRAFERARQDGRPALVVTFDPHPVRHFRPDSPPFRLTTVEQRARLLADLGVDAMLVLPFDTELAALDAPDFFDRILVQRLGIGGLVTGEGFHFGRKRSGDVPLLRRLGQPAGIVVDAEIPVMLVGSTVSSTRIRDELRAGNSVAAADLLSRPFVVAGVAIDDAAGTRVALGDYVRPRTATYRVRVRANNGETWRGSGQVIEATADGGDHIALPVRLSDPNLEIELLTRVSD